MLPYRQNRVRKRRPLVVPKHTHHNRGRGWRVGRSTKSEWISKPIREMDFVNRYELASEVLVIDKLIIPGTNSFSELHNCPRLINPMVLRWASSFGSQWVVPRLYAVLLTDFLMKESSRKSYLKGKYEDELSKRYPVEKNNKKTFRNIRSFLNTSEFTDHISDITWSRSLAKYLLVKHGGRVRHYYHSMMDLFPEEVQSMRDGIRRPTRIKPMWKFKSPVVSLPWRSPSDPEYTKICKIMVYLSKLMPLMTSISWHKERKASSQPFERSHWTTYMKRNHLTGRITTKKKQELAEERLLSQGSWWRDDLSSQASFSSFRYYDPVRLRKINRSEVYLPEEKAVENKKSLLDVPRTSTEFTSYPKLPLFSTDWGYHPTKPNLALCLEPMVNEMGMIPVEFTDSKYTLDLSILLEGVSSGPNMVEMVAHNLNNWLSSLPSPIVLYERYSEVCQCRLVTEVSPSDLLLRTQGMVDPERVAYSAITLLSDLLFLHPKQLRSYQRSRKVGRMTFRYPESSLGTSLTVYCESKNLFLGKHTRTDFEKWWQES